MFETHTTRTYDEAFALARRERAAAFRALLTFRLPRWSQVGSTRTA
ncbi:hypothetical protein JANAI62_04380 [Jannaschia pagri]|uniref:Uncharacterized protein n=1 Tax=Jannaschia pagri TaxID=2829797 RepID=A0ABQ4NHC5_9RHOB|nr:MULTISPECIES: hypothetical protein [unclassified Jannaschia]GIT90079.1 hypothetical protein JANAI61_05370 [Jannaschia sp. AI_61]GIT93815.1 hypothetical protein JANAI62_04380 [Jannaschia sp. AI_62]